MSNVLSPRDQALLRMAAEGKTGSEMQAETGLNAARAMIRVKELLRERNVYDEVERRQLLLEELYSLKNQLKEQTKDFVSDKQAKALIETIMLMDTILDKQGKITDEQLAKVSAAQAEAMLGMIVKAFEYAKDLLASDYPEVPVQEIEAAFRQGLNEQILTFGDDEV